MIDDTKKEITALHQDVQILKKQVHALSMTVQRAGGKLIRAHEEIRRLRSIIDSMSRKQTAHQS